MSGNHELVLPQTDENDLGHLNLGQETGESSGVDGEKSENLGQEIEEESLENGEDHNADEWWKYVQTLVKNEENENYPNDITNNNTSVG